MPRKAWCVLLLPIFAIGCEQPEMEWPPKKPEVASEMKMLEPMIGRWVGTA